MRKLFTSIVLLLIVGLAYAQPTRVVIIDSFPYQQPFDTSDGGWYSLTPSGNPTSTPWFWGNIYKPNRTSTGNLPGPLPATSRTAWTTGAVDHFYDNTMASVVISPRMNFSNIGLPNISMDIAWNFEEGMPGPRDALQMEFSTDDGNSWRLVPQDYFLQGGYNQPAQPGGQVPANIFINPSLPNAQRSCWASSSAGAATGAMIRMSVNIPELGGRDACRIRFRMYADADVAAGEAAFDGFVFDNLSIRNVVNIAAASSNITPNTGVEGGLFLPQFSYRVVSGVSRGAVVGYTHNGITFTETVNRRAEVGDIVTHRFSQPIIVSRLGRDTIRFFCADLEGDVQPSNDTLRRFFIWHPIANLPYTNNFQSNNGGFISESASVAPNTWAYGQIAKPIITGQPGNANGWVTGGLGNGLYNNSEISNLYSPVFRLPANTKPSISLSLWHNTPRGQDGARIEYSTNGGSNWFTVGSSRSGSNWYNTSINTFPGIPNNNAWSDSSRAWIQASNYLNVQFDSITFIQFRVHFRANPSVNSEGIAIDDFGVSAFRRPDLIINRITSPDRLCGATAASTVTINIRNIGAGPSTGATVNMRYNNGSVISQPLTQVIQAGDSLAFTFTQTINLTVAPGLKPIKVWLSNTNDANTFNDNDTLVANTPTVIRINPSRSISTFPLTESFDDPATTAWAISPIAPINNTSFEVGFVNKVTLGGPIAGAGSLATRLTGSHGTTESGALESACLDLSSMADPQISFSMKRLMSISSGLQLQYSTNSGISWLVVPNETEPGVFGTNWYNTNYALAGATNGELANSPNKNSVWSSSTLTPVTASQSLRFLRQYGGNVKLRLVFVSGGAANEGVVIDDLVIANATGADLAAASVAPTAGCALPATNQQFTVVVRNTRSSTYSGPVTFSIFRNDTLVVTENAANLNIPASSSTNYNFTQRFNFLNGTRVKVIIAGVNDISATNDTATSVVFNTTTIVGIPYIQSFEAGAEGWQTYSTGPNNWVLGTPAKRAPNALNTAAQGTNAWVTANLTGTYGNNERMWLVSPCFNLATVEIPKISFSMYFATTAGVNDGVTLQFTTDLGNTWNDVSRVAPNGIYNTASISSLRTSGLSATGSGWAGNGTIGWRNYTLEIPAVGRTTCRFRFVFASDASGVNANGVAMDNFRITDALPADMQLSAADRIVGVCGVQNRDSVRIIVQNRSLSVASSYRYFLTFNTGIRVNGNDSIYRSPSITVNTRRPLARFGSDTTFFRLSSIPRLADNVPVSYSGQFELDNAQDDTAENNIQPFDLVISPNLSLADNATASYTKDFTTSTQPNEWKAYRRIGHNLFKVRDTAYVYSSPTIGAVDFGGRAASVFPSIPSNNAPIVCFYESPCFNLSGILGTPIISLESKRAFANNNANAVQLQASTNGGTTWFVLSASVAPGTSSNWYNGNGDPGLAPVANQSQAWVGNSPSYQLSFTNAPQLSRQANVKFRLAYFGRTPDAGGGFQIRSFTISNRRAIDVTLNAITPSSSCGLSNNETVVVKGGYVNTDTLQHYRQVRIFINDTLRKDTTSGIVRGINNFEVPVLGVNLSQTRSYIVRADIRLFRLVPRFGNPGVFDTVNINEFSSNNNVYIDSIRNSVLAGTLPIYSSYRANPGDWRAYLIPGFNTQPFWRHGPATEWGNGTGWATGAQPNNQRRVFAVESPCYEIPESFNNGVRITIRGKFNLVRGLDGVILQSSTDNGLTWNTVERDNTLAQRGWYQGAGFVFTNSAIDTWTSVSDSLDSPTVNQDFKLMESNVLFPAGASNVKFRFVCGIQGDQAIYRGFASRGFLFDSVAITAPRFRDIAPIGINVSSGCGLTSTELLQVTVGNYMPTLVPANRYSAYLYVNGNLIDTAAGVSPINALNGNTLQTNTIVFNRRLDLGTPNADYQIRIITRMQDGDQNNFNDTFNTVITNVPFVNTFPFVERFNTQRSNWTQVFYARPDLNTFGYRRPAFIAANDTGNGTAAFWGNPTYRAREHNGIISPCFNVSSMRAPIVDFKIAFNSEVNADGITLEVTTNGGATWNFLGSAIDFNWFNTGLVNSLAGPGWSGNSGNRYIRVQHPIPSASDLRFRFRMQSDVGAPTAGSFFAIDSFGVREANPIEVELSRFQTPDPGGCRMADSLQPQIRFIQNGSDTVRRYIAILTYGAIVIRDTVTNASVAPKTSAVHTFSRFVPIPTGVNFTMTARMILDNEAVVINNTNTSNFIRFPDTLATGTTNNFDGNNMGTPNLLFGFTEQSGPNIPGPLPAGQGGWVATNDVQTAAIGHTGAKVVLGGNTTNFWLVSPPFNLNGGDILKVKAWGVRRNTIAKLPLESILYIPDDSLFIKVSTDCGASWITVDRFGPAELDGRREFASEVGAYGGPDRRIGIQVSSTTGSVYFTEQTEIIVDSIGLQKGPPVDARAGAFLTPDGTCNFTGDRINVKVRVDNRGGSVIRNFKAYLKVDNRDTIEYVSTPADSIPSLGSREVTFTPAEYFGLYTSYNMQFWVKADGDSLLSNDTLKTTATRYRTPSAPINFNAGTLQNDLGNMPTIYPGWFIRSGLTNSEPPIDVWNRGNIRLTMTRTSPAAMVELNNSDYTHWLSSPDFTVIPNSEFTFKAYVQRNGVRSSFNGTQLMELLYSTNCGTSWEILETFNASSFTNTFADNFSVSLASLANRSARFALRITDGPAVDLNNINLAIDDIQIVSNYELDGAVGSFINIPSCLAQNGAYAFGVNVLNTGGSEFPLDSYATLTINLGDTVITNRQELPLITPGTSAPVVFDLWQAESYPYAELIVQLSIPSESYTENNDGRFYIYSCTLPTGVTPLLADEVSLFPNPSNGTFFLNLGKASNVTTDVRIVDVVGRLVHKQHIASSNANGDIQVATSGLAKGVYQVLVNQNGKQIVKKLVIK